MAGRKASCARLAASAARLFASPPRPLALAARLSASAARLSGSAARTCSLSSHRKASRRHLSGAKSEAERLVVSPLSLVREAFCFVVSSLSLASEAFFFVISSLSLVHEAFCFVVSPLRFVHEALCFDRAPFWFGRGVFSFDTRPFCATTLDTSFTDEHRGAACPSPAFGTLSPQAGRGIAASRDRRAPAWGRQELQLHRARCLLLPACGEKVPGGRMRGGRRGIAVWSRNLSTCAHVVCRHSIRLAPAGIAAPSAPHPPSAPSPRRRGEGYCTSTSLENILLPACGEKVPGGRMRRERRGIAV